MSASIPTEFLNRPVRIALIGLSGAGLPLAVKLRQLHHLLIGAGHPGGLDFVIHESSYRLASELRRYDSKAFNTSNLLDFQFNAKEAGTDWDLLVSCNLSEPHRGAIARDFHNRNAKKHGVRYWIETESHGSGGSVVFQTLANGPLGSKKGGTDLCLIPDAAIPRPALGDSLASRLAESNPFTDDLLAGHAASLLWSFFRSGQIAHRGVVLNAEFGLTKPIPL